jgi:hypothetical protein
MFVTLLAAIVLGALRMSKNPTVVQSLLALQVPIVGWVVPYALCKSLLNRKLYPASAYAAAIVLYVLAFPFFALATAEAWWTAAMAGSYIGFFALHLLILRLLGYRLIHLPTDVRRAEALELFAD